MLKINVKLNGVNQALNGDPLKMQTIPTIFFGADVTHPAPGNVVTKPSIAAIVASRDLTATKWSDEVCHQMTRVEMIQDLESAAVKLITKFGNNTKKKPQRLIFFRDGVSEGQFAEVVRTEVAALKGELTH